MSLASLRTLRWCETVAGVTPRMETISPQFMRSVAEIASKILRRVLSARAFDIFSSSERFILNLECSEVVGLTATKQPGRSAPNVIKTATTYFDSHLII